MRIQDVIFSTADSNKVPMAVLNMNEDESCITPFSFLVTVLKFKKDNTRRVSE